jgi:CheY-like chemotaxis protein
MGKRVALINNDAALLAALQALLAQAGYEPHVFRGVLNTLADVQALAPHAIVLDIPLRRPAVSWELLALLQADGRLHAVPLILCSVDAVELQEVAPDLRRAGVHALPKPFEPAALLQLLSHALT